MCLGWWKKLRSNTNLKYSESIELSSVKYESVADTQLNTLLQQPEFKNMCCVCEESANAVHFWFFLVQIKLIGCD